jgi:ribonuclease-3 family protein
VINTKVLEAREVNQYSPLALAFLGDAVYGQLVRERLLLEANRPVGQLHQLATKRVCAAYQAKAAEFLLPMLSENEAEVLKRGRNATGTTVPKHSTAAEYRYATALESLFGYLHLLGKSGRIVELFDAIWNIEVE